MLQATPKGDNNPLMLFQAKLDKKATGQAPPDREVGTQVVSGANAELHRGLRRILEVRDLMKLKQLVS